MRFTADELLGDVSLIYQRWEIPSLDTQDDALESANVQTVLVVDAREQIENLRKWWSARRRQTERLSNHVNQENEKELPMSMLKLSDSLKPQAQQPSSKRSVAKVVAAAKADAVETAKIQDKQERIRIRAYQLFQKRNGVAGNPLADWLQAEVELKGK